MICFLSCFLVLRVCSLKSLRQFVPAFGKKAGAAFNFSSRCLLKTTDCVR